MSVERGESTMIETNQHQTDEQTKKICPKFEQTFRILGKKWNGLIIDVLLEGPKRFKDLSGQICDVSDRVLAERLKELEHDGLVERITCKQTSNRSGYCLTEKGNDLNKVMNEIQNWSDRWNEKQENEEMVSSKNHS